MFLSVVVPCYNEEQSVPALVQRLAKVIAPWKDRAEILLVDDGSCDATWAAIEAARAGCPQLQGIRLSGNRGHQIALTAGLEAARGERILMLDADLQDPPELLGDMMSLMDRGYDVVYGQRAERQGETMFKKVSAHVFYRVLNLLSDVDIPRDTGDFRLVSRRALDAVLAMPERARFVRGLFALVGFEQIALQYRRAPREAGETKYPLKKMVRLAVDAMTALSTKPLKIATRMAFLSLMAAAGAVVYLVWSMVTHQTAPGWASLFLTISIFSSIQLFTLGIMGEYIGRIYTEAKGRPLYFLSEDTRGTMAAQGTADPEVLPMRKRA